MKVLLAVLVSLLTVAAHADDMQKYLADTQALVRNGKHAEALARFQWFHAHALEHEPGMAGVRLSFALMYWKALGDNYPPARVALLELRDRTVSQVLETGGTFELFHDASALHRTFAEEGETVELFAAIDKSHPELAKKYWLVAQEPVLAATRFDLAAKYLGDPAKEFARIKAMYDENAKHYDDPKFGGDRFKRFNEDYFARKTQQLLVVTTALGKLDAAAEIQRQALEVLDDPRLQKAVSPTPTETE